MNKAKALCVGIYRSAAQKKECEENLLELSRLCDTHGIEVQATSACPIKKLDAGTFLGSGKIEELTQIVQEEGISIVVFDDEISPHQQVNLEKLFGCAVVDRTEIILEVFAQRALTSEARLQIELAQTRYQLPRLKRLWTHLSRQAGGGGGSGGGGYTKGEGEKQIEIDRRLLRRKLSQLEEELEQVVAQRATQRSGRLRSGIPTFAIVGYTNAGKSTLLRALTKADVLVEDKLFATLDTTTRKFTLPNGQHILLIDTVGFIRKIPHQLVAAFRSTLEEAVHTDILLHLIDASHPQAEEQAEATMEVLKQLGAEEFPIITVFNKIDAVTDPSLLNRLRLKYAKTVQISAEKGTGFDHLMEIMMQELSNLRKLVKLRIPQSHYALISEIMREGRVVSSEYEENDVLLEVEIPTRLEHKVLPFHFG